MQNVKARNDRKRTATTTYTFLSRKIVLSCRTANSILQVDHNRATGQIYNNDYNNDFGCSTPQGCFHVLRARPTTSTKSFTGHFLLAVKLSKNPLRGAREARELLLFFYFLQLIYMPPSRFFMKKKNHTPVGSRDSPRSRPRFPRSSGARKRPSAHRRVSFPSTRTAQRGRRSGRSRRLQCLYTQSLCQVQSVFETKRCVCHPVHSRHQSRHFWCLHKAHMARELAAFGSRRCSTLFRFCFGRFCFRLGLLECAVHLGD